MNSTHIVNPGDICELCDGWVSYHPQASQTAVTTEDGTSQIRFDPTAPIPALSDPNPDGYSSTLLTEVTERFVTQGLRTFVRDGYQSRETIVTQYRELRASYAIVLVFPDATEAWYGLAFENTSFQLQTGVAAQEFADLGHRIAASALVG